MPQSFVTRSEQETVDLAHRVGAGLKPGSTVLLRGDLGAGKTAFVRGLAEGLGLDPDVVTSPTFVIMQEYRGRTTLFHVDLYRLEGAAAIDDLGIQDLTIDGVVAIEWAERLPRPIEGAINVTIEDAGGDVRRITMETSSYSVR